MIENSKDVGISFRCNNKVSDSDIIYLHEDINNIYKLHFLYEKEIGELNTADGD